MMQSQRQMNERAWTRVRRWAAVWGLLVVLPWRTPEAWAQRTLDECLAEIPTPTWADAASQAFDRAFDSANDGDSFACQGYMRASAIRRAIDQFRQAVLYHDEKALREAVRFPTRVSRRPDPDNPRKVVSMVVKTPAEWWTMQQRYLTSRHLAVIACASLQTVSVMSGRGGYGIMHASGFIWWQQPVGDRDVKVTVVNISRETDASVIDACVPPTAVPK